VFRDLFHYAAFHLSDIAETARDVDLAIRWGYGWSLGPFETWQAAGWKQVADWIAEDIVAGKAMSSAPLPNWVFDGRAGVHSADGSFSPARNANVPRSSNPVYARQRFPDPLLGEKFSQGRTVFENEGIRMWADEGDDIAVVSFKTKMHTVNDHVLNGLQEAVAIAERVTKRQGELDPAVAVANTAAALRLVVGAADVRIAIHPSNYSTIEEALPKLRMTLPTLQHVELQPDPNIIPGGCRIFTAGGEIDADLDIQLQRITAALVPPKAGEGQ
jgi:hypothetical protein